MKYIKTYESPLGEMILASDGESLTGAWFEGQRYFPDLAGRKEGQKDLRVFYRTREWLDLYFRGEEPDFMPPLSLRGTEFQKEVWEILKTIPYGQTMTYGEIAGLYAGQHGLLHMSAQAVGQAVGHNPVSVLVPCHRVLGSGGKLTGYAGGIGKKEALLKLERVTGYETVKCGSAER